MKEIRLHSLFTTLLFIFVLNNIHAVLPLKMDELVKYKPAQAKLILQTIPQSSRNLPYYLLLVTAEENLGNHTLVDSLLDKIFENPALKEDSSLFIKFKSIGAENKKILDRFEEALLDLTFIINFEERHNDKKALLDSYLQLAEYFRATDNYDYALNYLNKVNEIGSTLPGGLPLSYKARMLNRKAAVYLEQARYLDSVEIFSKKVIEIGYLLNDLNQVATSSNELGFLYMNTNNLQAPKYFKLALSIWDSLGYGIYANNARLNLARYYSRYGQPREALKICLEELKIIKTAGWSWEEGYTYEVMSRAYYIIGEYKLAAYYADQAKEKLLFNSRNQYKAKLAYYTNKLQLTEKEEEISKKNLEVISANRDLHQTNVTNKWLFSILLAAIIILLGTFIGIILISRQKKQLSEQKSRIDEINTQLQNLVSQKEILLKEVNHRVKNNLSLLSGLIYLKEKELQSPEAVSAMRDMQGRINTISLIHENLYGNEDVEHIEFGAYLKQLTEQTKYIFSHGEKVQVGILCESYNPNISIAIPLAMVLNELLTNSLKHAFANIDQPIIKIEYDPRSHSIVYYDNGPGFSNASIKNSLGKRMISIFAQQIKSNIVEYTEDGFFKTKINLNRNNHEL